MHKSKTIIASLGLLFSSAVTPVLATDASWNSPASHPPIWQTNSWTNAVTIAAPSGTTGTITSASFHWAYQTLPYNPNNPTYTLQAKICTATTKCKTTPANNGTNDVFWAGYPANGSWDFYFNASSSQTKTLIGGPLVGNGNIQLSVNYSY